MTIEIPTPPSRIAILSDIHGNIVALNACLDDLAARGGADVIVAAGDLCMDGPKPKAVLKRLHEIGALCLRGNTDRYIAAGDDDPDDAAMVRWQRERLGPAWTRWLRDLPLQRRFGPDSNALLVTHANPKNDDEHVWPDANDEQLERLFGDVDAQAFAFGHLHLPYARLWRGKLLACVASAGLPKDGDPRAHYAIFTQRPGGWEHTSRRVEFDVEKVARQLIKSEIPDLERCLVVLRRHRYKAIAGIVP
jgi:putative phosphoesterase